MKNLSYLVLLALVVSCNDDIASSASRKKAGKERKTDNVEETTTNNLRSHLHRESGSPVLSYKEEISKIFKNDLPEISYRIIPMMEKDDEGSNKNVAKVDALGRPTVDCGHGNTFKGIKARIEDCAKKNGTKASWEGERYGAAGEGIWKLVSRNGSNKEVWIDERTGMVWSPLKVNAAEGITSNWCKASGNDEAETATEVVDCLELGESESLCANVTSDEDLGTDVKWRLPTRNDFLQADINGFRHVVKKENATGLWTATMRAASANRSEAWVYNSAEGTLSAATLDSKHQVRCIGAPSR